MKNAFITYTLTFITCIVMITTGVTFAETAWQSNGVPVCVVTSAQESPYSVGVGSGESIIVWADARGLDYDIYAQKLDADGQSVWADGGVKICGADYDQQFPAVVGDDAGGAIVVWQDGRLGDDGLDIYAQRVLSNGTVAWQTDGVPVCSHISGLTDPPMTFSHVVVGDGSGGVIVAWRDTRNDPINGNTEIYTQRLDGNGTAKWTLNGVKILGFGTQKWSTRNPIIASDGSGGAAIAWQDARTSATTGNDIYIQHITAEGSTTWTGNGVVVCDAIGDQGYPDIVDLTSGLYAIVWEDKRSGNYDIYAQLFDSSGLPQWGTNGLLICNGINDQRTPRVCSDGANGIIAAWTDKRGSTLYTDVYAQRIDPSGSFLWDNQGTAICTANGSQTRIRMVPSVSGLTFLTWMDTRNETISAVYDIYGQMIDSTAAPKWAVAGIPVSTITGSNQRMHQGATDGCGSICVVWEDDRNAGDWDIFSQKLSPWVSVTDITGAVSQSAGAPISIPARVVTGSFSGFFYVQEPERFAGIRVESSQSFVPGTMVTISGVMESGLEPYIKASLIKTTGANIAPGALGVNLVQLGNSSIGQTPGLSNTGLLVRTWGHVTSVNTTTQPYFVLTDDIRNVRVYSTSSVEIGDMVIVTGICSGESTVSGNIVTILTRDNNDVQKIEQ